MTGNTKSAVPIYNYSSDVLMCNPLDLSLAKIRKISQYSHIYPKKFGKHGACEKKPLFRQNKLSMATLFRTSVSSKLTKET